MRICSLHKTVLGHKILPQAERDHGLSEGSRDEVCFLLVIVQMIIELRLKTNFES